MGDEDGRLVKRGSAMLLFLLTPWILLKIFTSTTLPVRWL
jgi:hypothetical protein